MSYLINDNLIWIMTPKCASFSIERALLRSSLKLKKYDRFSEEYKDKHAHVSLNTSIDYFGNKESVCITRDWFEKWLSSINYIWDMIERETSFEPICKWEDLNNEIIYDILDTDFINNLHLATEEGVLECILRFLKQKNVDIAELKKFGANTLPSTLISEKFWKSNRKCTYEFDIRELDKFVDFMENRFGERLVIEEVNKSTKRPNKMIINDELKSFVWEKFERKFEKRNQLI